GDKFTSIVIRNLRQCLLSNCSAGQRKSLPQVVPLAAPCAILRDAGHIVLLCNGISRRLKDAQKAIAIIIAPPKKIRENANRNAPPRVASDPTESGPLGSLKWDRAVWPSAFCTGPAKPSRPMAPTRSALKSATPIAPASDLKRSRDAMPTPVSS